MIGDDGGGAYFWVLQPDGRMVSGIAPDEARARAVMESVDQGRSRACKNCMGVVVHDDVRGTWVHQSYDPGADPLYCYANRKDLVATPLKPVSLVRPYVPESVSRRPDSWPGRTNICGPE